MDGNVELECKRKRRLIKSFLFDTAWLAIVALTIIVAAWVVTDTPILTNQMALSQMENSNEWFVAMVAYQKFADATNRIRDVLVSVIVGVVGWNGIDLAKTLKT